MSRFELMTAVNLTGHPERATRGFELSTSNPQRRRALKQWGLCFALACALHLGVTLFRGDRPIQASFQPSEATEPSAAAIDVGLLDAESPRPPGPAPGGGSSTPSGPVRASAPEQLVKPQRHARPVTRAPEVQVRASNEHLVTAAATFPAGLLTTDEAEPDRVRPQAARRRLLAEDVLSASTTSPDAALQVASVSRTRGEGFGSNGGPGGSGRGRGNGVIAQRFAFGGPTGAFQASVCYIENTVQRLADIGNCTPVATFFTSELNVPPRAFESGFPGLGRRTEWFAIKYRGKFSVRVDDSYTFRLLSDDGAILEVDGQQILNNDGQHPPRSVSRSVRLAPGGHDFYLFYYQGPAAFLALQLFVTRSQHEERLFTAQL